jgi:cytochrome P450
MLRPVSNAEIDYSSTDFYFDPLPGPDFARALHSLRKQGPVVPTSAVGGALPIFYIVGYEALAEAFRDGERFPPHHAYQIISQPFIGETFMSMAPDRHRLWRPAMTPAFRRATVERLADAELAGVAHELIDRVEAAGRGDLVRNFTRLFAFAIICRQLGLPRDHEDEFYDWSMDLMFGGRDLEKSRAADAKLTAFVTPVLEARRREARDDVISSWLDAHVQGEFGEEAISDAAILAHIRLFFTAGATTTSDALGNLVHALLSHRDRAEIWRSCTESPARCDDAVQELLRWNPPVAAQPRFSRPDTEIEFFGRNMGPTSSVLFGIAAANRDPDVYPDPDRFDIDRRPKELLSFGPGLRTCPGMHLARKNLRVALRVLAERLPALRLIAPDDCAPRGILLRGPGSLPARWD